MSNIAVHIERVLSGVVAVDANVIFENIVFLSENITTIQQQVK